MFRFFVNSEYNLKCKIEFVRKKVLFKGRFIFDDIFVFLKRVYFVFIYIDVVVLIVLFLFFVLVDNILYKMKVFICGIDVSFCRVSCWYWRCCEYRYGRNYVYFIVYVIFFVF